MDTEQLPEIIEKDSSVWKAAINPMHSKHYIIMYIATLVCNLPNIQMLGCWQL